MFRIFAVAIFLIILDASFAADRAAESFPGYRDAGTASNGFEPNGDVTRFTPGVWQTGFQIPNGCSWLIGATAASPNGMLYLGGMARECGGVPGLLFAYDPATNAFNSLGHFTNPGGFPPRVTDIAIEGNHLYAVGRFKFVDGIEVNHIARFDLSSGTWSQLGEGAEIGISSGFPHAVEADANDVYVGFSSGRDSRVGTLDVNTIARWNIVENTWSGMSGGLVLPGTNDPLLNVASVHDLILVGGTLYVGGSFTSAGGSSIEGVATFAPGAGWSQLGAGIQGTVRAVETDGTKVYAAMNDSVVEFDGAGWSTVASSLGGFGLSSSLPNALLLTDEFLYLGGWFTAVDGLEASNVARFDLSTREWESLGVGADNGVTGGIIGFLFQIAVDSLAKIGDDIYTGGALTGAGAVTANNIARWDDSSNAWEPIGTSGGKGVSAQDIWDLATDGREVLIAGPLAQSGLAPTRWVGRFDIVAGTWSAFGDASTRELLGTTSQIAFAGEEIFANVSEGLTDSIDSLATSEEVNGIVRWDPAAQDWATMGPADSPGLTDAGSVGRNLKLAGGADALYVTGRFARAGDTAANNIARWDLQEQTWSSMGAGLDIAARSIGVSRSGEVYVAGLFTRAGGLPAYHAAMWDPETETWSPLGAGISNVGGSGPFIEDIVFLPNGDVVFAGRFNTAGTVQVNNIARWDGTQWHALGDGLTFASGDQVFVRALAVSPTGEVFAAGYFDQSGAQPLDKLGRWNGSTWSAVGPSLAESEVEDASIDGIVVIGPDVFIAGAFARVGGVVATNFARFVRDLGGPDLNLIVTGRSPGGDGTVARAAFQIVVENTGGNNAFETVFSPSITPAPSNVSWTCVPIAESRARCPQPAGSGVPELIVDLPSNDGLYFELLAESAPETLFQDLYVEAETTSAFGEPDNFAAIGSASVAVTDEGVFKNDFEF